MSELTRRRLRGAHRVLIALLVALGSFVVPTGAAATDHETPWFHIAEEDIDESSFADALAVGPLVATEGSRLLLTPGNRTDDDVLAAITGACPDEIIAVGGTAALSDEVLESYAAAVTTACAPG